MPLIRCPKCGDAFAVPPSNGMASRLRKPAAPVEDDENPFEVVD